MDSNQRNVNTVLMILEELDSYVFEKIDTVNSLESLYSRLFNGTDCEDTLVHTLCEWAVTVSYTHLTLPTNREV